MWLEKVEGQDYGGVRGCRVGRGEGGCNQVGAKRLQDFEHC